MSGQTRSPDPLRGAGPPAGSARANLAAGGRASASAQRSGAFSGVPWGPLGKVPGRKATPISSGTAVCSVTRSGESQGGLPGGSDSQAEASGCRDVAGTRGGGRPPHPDPPATPAGLLPVDGGRGPPAKSTAAWVRRAAGPLAFAATDALPAGRPASASAQELVPGLPQADHGPAGLPQAAHERLREDVLLRGGGRPPGSSHQARCVRARPLAAPAGLAAMRMGLAFRFTFSDSTAKHSQL